MTPHSNSCYHLLFADFRVQRTDSNSLQVASQNAPTVPLTTISVQRSRVGREEQEKSGT